ncbi:MAG: hypothetical protein Q9181_005105 [Wetmoreana brouardii]
MYSLQGQYSYGNSDLVEDREKYRTGGFHPVHLKDEFKDSRYRVIHKLGYGGFSTVSLARDRNEDRYVALKITAAAETAEAKELRILEYLESHRSTHPGKKRVINLFDYFVIEGPNGTHACFVFPIVGPSVTQMIDSSKDRRLATAVAKGVSSQIGQGLAYLHSAASFMEHFDSWSEDEIYRRLGKPYCDHMFTRSGDDPGPEAPKAVVELLNMAALGPQYLADDIIFIDLGASFFANTSWLRIEPPESYCAPEIIFDRNAGLASDIWSLGCTILEVCHGFELFTRGFLGPNHDDILARMAQVLGPLPAEWWKAWESRHGWFDEDGALKIYSETGMPGFPLGDLDDEAAAIGKVQNLDSDGESKGSEGTMTPLDEQSIPQADRLLSRESAALADLLSKMLRYSPQARIHVEVCQHKFLRASGLNG